MQPIQQLRQLFTSYWHYLPIQTACKIDLFDHVLNGNNTLEALAKKTDTNLTALSFLLNTLITSDVLKTVDARYYLTQKGEYLTEVHPKSVKYSAILWGEEHLTAWQHLEYTLLKGAPSFEYCYQRPFFEYLKEIPRSNEIYHKAMFEYARDDYEAITEYLDLDAHRAIMDVGGGLGALLMAVRASLSNTHLYLLDTANVIELLPKNRLQLFTPIVGDFFSEIPALADGIIMSRVLHDWNDEAAQNILKNTYKSLPKEGKLYIIEILKEDLEDGAHHLNLNMLLICNSYERTFEAYKMLLNSSGFDIIEKRKINDLQSALICQKI